MPQRQETASRTSNKNARMIDTNPQETATHNQADSTKGSLDPTSSASLGSNAQVAHFEDLVSPLTLSQADQEEFMRRFSTLFIDEDHSRMGGLGKVHRGTNALGEKFAIKTLSENDFEGESLAAVDNVEADEEATPWYQRAFDQEYETHRLLSGIKGFPRVYAKGNWNGKPAIIMEWIEGSTLAKAQMHLAIDDQNRLSPLVAAQLGRDLFDLLVRMDLLDEGLVHRDISPSNVMISTHDKSIEDQAKAESFDLRLIDFGSAALSHRNASLTERFCAPRGATPAFAPPEMLTEDIPDVSTLRKSPSVDVYSAASVIYFLLTGHVPFEMSSKSEVAERLSPYRIKVENDPISIEMAYCEGRTLNGLLSRDAKTRRILEAALDSFAKNPTDDDIMASLAAVNSQLSTIVLACIASEQSDRPTASQMREAFGAFVANYGENLKRALKGEGLIPISQKLLVPQKTRSAKDRISKNKGRIAMQAIFGLLGVAVIATCAILMNGLPARIELFGHAFQGPINGPIIAGALLIPPLFGALLRWSDFHGKIGFIRATVGVALGLCLLLTLFAITTFVEPSFGWTYLCAAFAASACSWLFFVADYAVTKRSDNDADSQPVN